MDRRISVEPFPPGEYLQEFMEGKDWTQDDLAEVLECSRQHVNRLLQGKTSVTPETAVCLSEAFGTSAELWLNLQASYELSRAAQEDRNIKRRAAIYERFPVREMQKREWISGTKDVDGLERSICEFLRTEDIEDEPSIAVAARKGTSYSRDTIAQKAWYMRALRLAEHAPSSKYVDSNLQDGTEDLLKLAAYPEDTRRVPKVLADMGIRLVVVQHLKKTKIDGAAFWLDNSTPAIALSLRYGRIDNFWFTLFHEIVHVKYRESAPIDVDLVATQRSDDLTDIEQRANREAANYLIAEEKLDSFILRTRPLYYQQRIIQFAQARGVHPGVVVGQLQGRGELTFKQLRKLLVKVRSEIIGSVLHDGWDSA